MRCLCLLCLCLLAGLSASADPYSEEIDAWHADRLRKLTEPEGWLSLAGLHWLSEEKQTFPVVGEAWLEGEVAVILQPGRSQPVRVGPDQPEGTPTFENGEHRFYVIRRGPAVGLRVKDRRARLRLNFPGIERFPVDPRYRIQGVLESDQTKLDVDSVVGVATTESSPGWARFSWQGQEHRVRLLGEPEDSKFFLVFSDATAGKTTYSACRFLVVERQEGTLILDFNKAYNPPCAFTHYATCPLPFEENVLPFPISAGEKLFD